MIMYCESETKMKEKKTTMTTTTSQKKESIFSGHQETGWLFTFVVVVTVSDLVYYQNDDTIYMNVCVCVMKMCNHAIK